MKDMFNNNSRPLTMVKEQIPYQVDSNTSGIVYQRFQSGTGKVLILRITTATNVITYEKAFDTWANRATATYVAIDADL